MANIKTKLGSLAQFDRFKKRQEWKLKIHRLQVEANREKKLKKQEEKKAKHAAHLRACAAKALKKAEYLESRMEPKNDTAAV